MAHRKEREKVIKTPEGKIPKKGLFYSLKSYPYFRLFIILSVASSLPIAFYHLFNPHGSILFKEWTILNSILLGTHIFAAIFAIIIGPFLFIKTTRTKYLKWHKFFGKIYIYGCFISAVTIFPIALVNSAGFVAHLGFGVMAIVWFGTTYLSFTAVRHKDIVSHRRWIMRSYALTFAFVNVNIFYRMTLPYDLITLQSLQAMQSMVSWLINLFFVELYLEATTVNGKFKGFKNFLKSSIALNTNDKPYFSLKRCR